MPARKPSQKLTILTLNEELAYCHLGMEARGYLLLASGELLIARVVGVVHVVVDWVYTGR